MAIQIKRTSCEPHPEGWFPFCVRGVEEADGQFGRQLKWRLESKERDSEGQPFTLTYYTSMVCNERSKLGALAAAVGVVEPDFDAEDLIGKTLQCRVDESKSKAGDPIMIIGAVRGKAAKSAPRLEFEKVEKDPFADE